MEHGSGKIGTSHPVPHTRIHFFSSFVAFLLLQTEREIEGDLNNEEEKSDDDRRNEEQIDCKNHEVNTNRSIEEEERLEGMAEKRSYYVVFVESPRNL
ncbi:hypothetical protein RHMOL_Rhmol13G0268400 [Rhododendron molle]|uniref:Uncharacterized protein n=1 Tax=Rhododendron molle TaxID=49168 RepID=A0ACC0LCP5_RHOML|nr:hypothetical protein RHMOL_Rhmol13G0268400 [Rhododendron molle]